MPAAPVVLTATTVDFTEFNVGGTRTLDPAVRIFGPGATVAQDLEPEYITVAGDRAFVTLQENNAIAEIDIESASVIAIRPLALKDHSLRPATASIPVTGTRSATRDRRHWAVTGARCPDAIDSFTVKGRTYLITANEGDARAGLEGLRRGRAHQGPEVRFRARGRQDVSRSTRLTVASLAALGTNGKAVSDDTNLGRLKISTAPGRAGGDTDADGDIDQLRTFGTRIGDHLVEPTAPWCGTAGIRSRGRSKANHPGGIQQPPTTTTCSTLAATTRAQSPRVSSSARSTAARSPSWASSARAASWSST